MTKKSNTLKQMFEATDSWLGRKAIAQRLGKNRLNPSDIACLEKLVTSGFLIEKSRIVGITSEKVYAFVVSFMNCSERYGDNCPVTIADYEELNPDGQFEIRTDEIRGDVVYDGIYECYEDEHDGTWSYELVAEDKRLNYPDSFHYNE